LSHIRTLTIHVGGRGGKKKKNEDQVLSEFEQGGLTLPDKG